MGSNNDPVSHYPVDCCCRQCEKMLTLDCVCLCTFKWAVCVDAEFVNRSVKVVCPRPLQFVMNICVGGQTSKIAMEVESQSVRSAIIVGAYKIGFVHAKGLHPPLVIWQVYSGVFGEA